MNIYLRRLGAYLIDYLIITIILNVLMLISFINPNKVEYNTKYNEIINVNEQFVNNEISESEFNEAIVPIAYDLYRLNGSYVIVSTICFLLYFVVFQYYFHGQTIGKKLLKLKVEGAKENKITIGNFLVRSVILYNILIPILELLVVYIWKVDSYYPVYQNINLVGYIIIYSTIFTALIRKDGRGLHDLFANTKVVYDESLEVFNPLKKVIDVKEEIKDSKKTVKKKTNTKGQNKKQNKSQKEDKGNLK